MCSQAKTWTQGFCLQGKFSPDWATGLWVLSPIGWQFWFSCFLVCLVFFQTSIPVSQILKKRLLIKINIPVQSWATYTQRSFNTVWDEEALVRASLKVQYSKCHKSNICTKDTYIVLAQHMNNQWTVYMY